MTKTPVKFQKNRHKIVRGVAHTRYLLLLWGRKYGTNAEYYVTEKAGSKPSDVSKW